MRQGLARSPVTLGALGARVSIQEVADPVPGNAEVLISVKAFGVNHAETHIVLAG